MDEYKKKGKQHTKKFTCEKYGPVYFETMKLLQTVRDDDELSVDFLAMLRDLAADGRYVSSLSYIILYLSVLPRKRAD